MMINKDPIEVSENITTIIKADGSKDIKDLIKELDELYNKHVHQNYERFTVALVPQKLKIELVLVGWRKEKPEETKRRIMVEEERDKRNNDAELKEYLRLKKKFGKEENNE